ncbi:hypothetical protein CS0771_66160 [Catellatospora sp. IY07-71]|uniref:hypothetical protein n=1 Tax=Catellatospora sp. IY07-71 TaxID=2728827 RepID=UPI001BB3D6EB|nr:hypothetical protein [Catellatospora sp. IY07-71]BCJ77072.1 hypothetical protein CS0771_66160 [Catellatospora sp. IY07-71]
MAKNHKNNQSRRHPEAEQPAEQDQPGTPHAEHEHGPDSHPGWATERAEERSRQAAMAAREKTTRTHMPTGQSTGMHLRKGNQPRGGR